MPKTSVNSIAVPQRVLDKSSVEVLLNPPRLPILQK
jgi:hypothetical protein